MFRWGILSTAKIAREQMIPAIIASHNGTVTAIASRSADRARALADQIGVIKAYGTYDGMLEDPDIDGVYIALPAALHAEWAGRAAEAGKHVLCEKPMANTAADIRKLMGVSQKTGKAIAEAFMVYYHPQWRKVRDLIAGGQIGTLAQVQGAFSFHNTDPANIRNDLSLCGGAIGDIGVYPVVTTRMATRQEPHEVSAQIIRSAQFGIDETTRVSAKFDGFSLDFYVSMKLSQYQRMAFHGDKGIITLDAPFNAGQYGHAQVRLINADNSAEQVFRFSADQYKLQAEAFVSHCRGVDTDIFTLENSLANAQVIDMIRACE